MNKEDYQALISSVFKTVYEKSLFNALALVEIDKAKNLT